LLLANVGIPMVFVTVPTMLVALLPIALVESWILSCVCGLKFNESWRGALKANFWSTVLGIPVAWLILVVAQMASGNGRAWGIETPLQRLTAVTLQAPWLVPYERHLNWMIPAASLTLLIPFFLASVIAEYIILRKRWGTGQKRLLTGVVCANALSYALMGGYYAVSLLMRWDRIGSPNVTAVT
jgi:hypothetical protein